MEVDGVDGHRLRRVACRRLPREGHPGGYAVADEFGTGDIAGVIACNLTGGVTGVSEICRSESEGRVIPLLH